MIRARRLPAATALSSVAGALLVLLFTADAQAKDQSDTCGDAAGLAFLSTPYAPWKGVPLQVLFTSEKPFDGEISLIAPDGSVAAKSNSREGGPPYYWSAEVASPAVGTWHAKLAHAGSSEECTHDITVRAAEGPRPRAVDGSLWPLRANWDRATENLYSAWIEKLFYAPVEDAPSWKALHEVLRDKSRNILFNYMGLREDQIGLIYHPDCADLPYFLRAYFAFKMGLPFGYSKCTRGGGGQAPKCFAWWNVENLEPSHPAEPDPTETGTQMAAAGDEMPASGNLINSIFRQPAAPRAAPAHAAPHRTASLPHKPVVPRLSPAKMGLALAFGTYVRQIVADAVHSATARTALNDENTDYYPVALTDDALRPGTIYADPYGHVLMLVRRLPQTPEAAGLFVAVDAQPDGTVAEKRFWRGNFLFAQNPALGGPGFKRFRPIVRANHGLRRLTNEELSKDPQYAAFSLDQAKLSVEGFYDRMDDVMSPQPLDPERAMKEAISALEEQVKARVTSVENGRKYQGSGKGDAAMPDGPAIFETTGAWEDFATPSRDLRILIAIDVVRNFPDRVARRPERYAMPQGKSVDDVKADLQSLLASELVARKFTYTRTDGSPWTLTLKDVLDRAGDLEMAYNVNDCVELRWGAVDKSGEAATCKRHAPAAQRAKMGDYRAWFHERRRPPRA